ncbi:MAG: hypothetical protein AB3N15_18180 [Paracoccaceae bacterium]
MTGAMNKTSHALFLQRVWTDEAFATDLQENPKDAVSAYLGDLPDDLDIRVVRDTENTCYVHIPAAPEGGEISDADLALTQGGTTFGCLMSATVAISATVTVSMSVSVEYG